MLIHVKLNTTSNLHHVNIFIYCHCYAACLNKCRSLVMLCFPWLGLYAAVCPPYPSILVDGRAERSNEAKIGIFACRVPEGQSFCLICTQKNEEAASDSATKQPKQKLPVDINLAAVSRTEGESLLIWNVEIIEKEQKNKPPLLPSYFLFDMQRPSHRKLNIARCIPIQGLLSSSLQTGWGYIIITPGKKELSHRRAVSMQVSSLLSLLLGGRSFFVCHPSAARGHR